MYSILKIFEMIILNGIFIYFWKNKENYLMKSFWIRNCIYLLVINNFFRTILKTIVSKIDIFNDVDLYYIKLLKIDIVFQWITIKFNNVDKFLELNNLFNVSLSILTIFIGLIAFITAIYIYILGVNSQVKRHILSYLSGHGNMFLLGFTLILMFLLGGKERLLLGGTLYLIYLLFRSVNWIVDINSTSYFNNNFVNILSEFRGVRKTKMNNENKDVMDLYLETKEELQNAVKDMNYIKVKDNFMFLRLEINEFFDDLIGNEGGKESNYEIRKYIQTLYDLAQKNKNCDIYSEINQLHFIIAEKFYNKDLEGFGTNLSLMYKNYEYYLETTDDRFAWDTLSYMDGILSQIFRDYRQDFKASLTWFSKSYLAIQYCTEIVIKNNDVEFFEQILKLIKVNTEYRSEEENIQNFILLECSFYFGILVYLKSKKIKNRSKFIKMVRKKINYSLSYNFIPNLYLLMDLYNFIKKNMIATMFEWDKYVRPKMELIGVTSWIGDGREIINNVFLELISGLEEAELKLVEDDEKRIYLDTNLVEIEDDFLQYVSSIRATLSNIEIENKKVLIKLFDKLSKEEVIAYDNEVKNSSLSKEKLEKVKETIEKSLKENKLINYLNEIKKYKILKDKNKELDYMGVSELYPKSMFIESIRGIGVAYEHNIKQLAEAQINGMNQLFANKLDLDKVSEFEVSFENALAKVKGKKAILLSKIMLIPIIFKEGKKIRSKVNLEKNEATEYKNFIEGFYENVPIFYINSNFKGGYVLNLDDIDKFIHYNPVEKDDDKLIEYCAFRLRDMNEVLKNPKEREKFLDENLNAKVLQEKEEKLKTKVWIELLQKGELILNKDVKVYKIKKEDLLTKEFNER